MPNSSREERSRYICMHLEELGLTIVSQEFRAELQAAETKDKKFVKRKIALKKIVANITMGNDSWYTFTILPKSA
jgi:hypothetical protein